MGPKAPPLQNYQGRSTWAQYRRSQENKGAQVAASFRSLPGLPVWWRSETKRFPSCCLFILSKHYGRGRSMGFDTSHWLEGELTPPFQFLVNKRMFPSATEWLSQCPRLFLNCYMGEVWAFQVGRSEIPFATFSHKQPVCGC